MESEAEEFVGTLLNGEPHRQPTHSSGDVDLPKWYDEKKYNRGRQFFKDFYFGFASSYMIGMIIVLSLPSIAKVLSGTRKSNTPRTAYLRYWDTFQQFFKWFQYELKPGSKSWDSLHKVRGYHLQVIKSAKLKGHETISQRDVALTQGAAVAYAYLKPDEFGIFQRNDGDFDAYNHFWAVIGYFMGLEDRYNICLKPFEMTYEICKIFINRVFTPCLENPPEYFEHLARTAIEGASAFYPAADPECVVFMTKNLSGVPGYVIKESERILLKKKLIKLNGNSPDIGVKSTDLIEKCAIEGLPQREPRLMYLSDFDSIDSSPAYKQLSLKTKYNLALANITIALYSTFIGRVIINLFIRFQLFISKYFPFIAIWKFGFSGVYIDGNTEDAILKPNSEFDKSRPLKY